MNNVLWIVKMIVVGIVDCGLTLIEGPCCMSIDGIQ